MTTPPTEQQLDEIETRHAAASPGPWKRSEDYSDVLAPDGSQLASYWRPADGEFIAHAPGDVRTLLDEVRRLQGQRRYLIDQLARKNARSGEADKRLREFLGGEHQPGPDTLPAWLYQRFAVIHGCAPWDQIDDGQRAYWEHQARAVRRAVERGGFKAVAPDAASVPPGAPVSPSQPSSVSESMQSPTGAAEGALRDSGPEAEIDAIHTHFGLSYCNYLVLPRTLLQSMDDEWQTPFVALLDQLETAFRHVPQADRYRVEAATEHIVGEMSDAELRQAGITEDWYRGETPPEGLDGEELREWQAAHEDAEGPAYSRDGEELDRHQRVLIPAADPIPHYDRGRARIEPAVEETHIVADDSSDPEHVDDCPGCATTAR